MEDVTLKEYLMDLLDERDRRYEDRFVAQERAILKAETATEKRFEGVNEFRNTLADQQRTLMPRAEAELTMKALDAKIDSMIALHQNQSGEKVGLKSGWGWAAAVVALAIAIYSFISK